MMNGFSERWAKLTGAARNAGVERLPELPAGFATRVVARANAEANRLPSWLALFERWGVRVLAGVAVAAAVAGAVQATESPMVPDILPAVEDAVGERLPAL